MVPEGRVARVEDAARDRRGLGALRALVLRQRRGALGLGAVGLPLVAGVQRAGESKEKTYILFY